MATTNQSILYHQCYCINIQNSEILIFGGTLRGTTLYSSADKKDTNVYSYNTTCNTLKEISRLTSVVEKPAESHHSYSLYLQNIHLLSVRNYGRIPIRIVYNLSNNKSEYKSVVIEESDSNVN